MAKRGPKGPNATTIKAGETRNPGGRPKLSPEVKALRAISGEELSRIISKYFRLPVSALYTFIADPTAPSIHVYICTMITSAIEMKDPSLAKELLERMCGKVKDQLQIELNRDEEVKEQIAGVPKKNIFQALRETAAMAA